MKLQDWVLRHSPFAAKSGSSTPRAAPGSLEQDFATVAPGQWLLKEIPWSSAEHRIRAVAANDMVACDLGWQQGLAWRSSAGPRFQGAGL